MIGGGTWEAVGLLDKLPVQVAAAGAAAVFRSIADTTLPQIRSKKPFFGGILWPSPFVF
jgi:hypothetical protein